ncbi:MAG: tRNA dihydrouridine(20/20a) synthase DusA [Alphaproteobacteria bacterium]|nr:tRNA dihydrouridine(20/20a) synthase DusA [Alphaproteobacteria bacterium]
MTFPAGRLSVAPMMDWTDRHFRYFIRRFSRRVQLYSEMITAQAIVFGDAEKLLAYNKEEHPIVLQLGGSDPELLAKACQIAKSFNYDEINLNAGCPSERVASGCFGASLRKDPRLIADCLKAMRENSDVPVTLKTRIALQEETQDSDGYDNLCRCAELAEKAGCQTFIIHARKARLKGFTPKQNRERLPLNYELIYRFKRDFPRFTVSINGNITSLEQAKEHLNFVDGVMIGRALYADPYMSALADRKIFEEDTPVVSRAEAVQKMLPYLEKEMANGVRPHLILRHWLGLFKGLPGAALWRRTLTETMFSQDCSFKTVAENLNSVISSF